MSPGCPSRTSARAIQARPCSAASMRWSRPEPSFVPQRGGAPMMSARASLRALIYEAASDPAVDRISGFRREARRACEADHVKRLGGLELLPEHPVKRNRGLERKWRQPFGAEQ